MHDLLIKNARICDGLGAPIFGGDLAVANGRIAAIGKDVGTAKESIDADGLTLAPGIIDTHTHYDAQITWDAMATPSTSLGVTTVIIGNCGFTIAPARPAHRDRIMRNLTQVEGMSLAALRNGIKWDFESFPEYMNLLERQGIGPNVVAFVGHSSVRTYVLGDDASSRTATDAEIEQMRAIVAEAMRAGAVGFSTTTAEAHNGEGGIPMPSRLADKKELMRLTGVLGEQQRGAFMITKGEKTTVASLEEIGAQTGRPVIIAALLHDNLNPDGVFQDLRDIAAARARGHALIGAVACTPLTFEFSLRSPYPLESFASWQRAFRATPEELPGVLADRAFRQAMKDELAVPIKTRAFNGEWDKLFIVQVADRANAAVEGGSVGQLAAKANKHPLDWMFDFALSEKLDTIFISTLKNSDEGALTRMLHDPNSMISLSDAGAHLTFFCDAGFGLHLLGYWVRERGIMSLEQAVQKITSFPARVYGIRERGYLKPGAWADLMLFDPATVARAPSRRTWDLPSGASRLTCDPVGLHGVWINGARVLQDNKAISTQRAPGKLLREFAADQKLA
jgi:N-acyl-D-aspartate/D-glutamate deacylase